MKHITEYAEGSIRNYKDNFAKFVEWMNRTPDELFAMHQRAIRARLSGEGDVRKGFIMESHVNEFLNHLRQPHPARA